MVLEFAGNKCGIPLALWLVLYIYSWLIASMICLTKVYTNQKYSDEKYSIKRFYCNKYIREVALWMQIGT